MKNKYKYPWYSRFYFLQKIWCAFNLHVPVASMDHKKVKEVFCQECFKVLSVKDWEKYFGGKING